MDTTDAAVNDIPVASVVNPGVTSNAGVAPTANSLAAALTDGTQNADGTITPDYKTQDPNAYPLPMLTYAVVPTTQKWPGFTAGDGKMLRAFIKYATGSDGQKLLPAGGFPLPPPQVQKADSVAAEIPTTEPATGGGHHHSGGNGNGNGSGGTNGGGSTTPLSQTGCCSSTTTTSPPPGPAGGVQPPPPGPASKAGSGTPNIRFTPVGNIAASSSSAAVPILITLAVLGLLIAPLAMLLSRRDQSFDLSSALNSLKWPWRTR